MQDLETASRHLRALSSAILCIYSFNLFVCNLPQLIAGVFAPPRPEYLRGRNTRAKPEAALFTSEIFLIAKAVSNPSRRVKAFILTVTVKRWFLSPNDKLFTAGRQKTKGKKKTAGQSK